MGGLSDEYEMALKDLQQKAGLVIKPSDRGEYGDYVHSSIQINVF